MMTLLGPGSRTAPPRAGHDWMRAPGCDDRRQLEQRRVAYRCQRCMTVYFLLEGVLPRPEDGVEVSGVRYETCEEAAAAQVLSS